MALTTAAEHDFTQVRKIARPYFNGYTVTEATDKRTNALVTIKVT
jgi:hypothetical protein